MDRAPTLARLVAPHTPDAFVDAWFGRRSLHVRTTADRFADLRLAEGAWIDWLRDADPVDAARRDEHGRQVQTRIEVAQAREMFARGMTICADVSRHPAVAEVLAGLTADLRPFCGACFAKLYVSPPGAGFAPHMDGHHVFVVQMHGQKRWCYGEGPALPFALVGGKLDADGRPVHTYPRDGWPILDADGAPIAAPDFARASAVVLQPGDVLYLPPGTWHTTEAIDTSIALSVSPPRTPIAALLVDALRDRLHADPRLWQDLVALPQADGRGPPLAIERGARFGIGRLERIAASVHPTDLHLWWARQTFASAPDIDAAPAQPPGSDDLLAHADGGFVWLRAHEPGGDADAIFVFRPGVELVLPVHAERFVKRLHARPRLTVADACGFEPAWPSDDVRQLLGGLLDAGVLVRADLNEA